MVWFAGASGAVSCLGAGQVSANKKLPRQI